MVMRTIRVRNASILAKLGSRKIDLYLIKDKEKEIVQVYKEDLEALLNFLLLVK